MSAESSSSATLAPLAPTQAIEQPGAPIQIIPEVSTAPSDVSQASVGGAGSGNDASTETSAGKEQPPNPLVLPTSTTPKQLPSAEETVSVEIVPASPVRSKSIAASSSSQGPSLLSPRASSRLKGKQDHREDGESLKEAQAAEPQTLPQPEPQPQPQPQLPTYLQPAEFFPLSNHSHATTAPPPMHTGQPVLLSPEDDKLATRGIPIFRPTMEEFEDFEGYVTKTVAWGQYSGIVKIVPPAEWKQSLPPIPNRALADVRIKQPIQQNMLGQAGLFRQTNVEKQKTRPLSIEEWFKKSQDKKFAGPGPKDIDRTVDRDSKEAKELRMREAQEFKRKREETRSKREQALNRKKERQAAAKTAQGGDSADASVADVTMDGVEDEDGGTPSASQNEKGVGAALEGPAEAAEVVERVEENVLAVPPLDPSHESPHSSPDPLAKTPESSADDVPEWYEKFDPARDWLPEGTEPTDYTPEACAAIEKRFWKTMGFGEPSWYGADLLGSLFPDPETKWNVANLPNLLNRLGRDLPGVNRPYLYFGMWRAAFAWHVEDMDLFSINYIHFGAPKFWYAIPQGQAEQFERTITSYFPREASQCDQFLRHKSYIMSPTKLAKDGINVNMLVHNQGEFVITYPRGYHAGFNMGFNCAESVNFALDSWLELGRRAKVCQCVNHSVRIDVDELLGEHEERMRTEQDLLRVIEEERAGKPRKRAVKGDGDRPRKRTKPDPSIVGSDADLGQTHPSVYGLEKKKIILNLSDPLPGSDNILPIGTESERKAPVKKPRKSNVKPVKPVTPTYFPCILCPNTTATDLMPVWEPSDQVKAMCKSEDGVVRAHRDCVNSVPEVWSDDKEIDGVLQAVVLGVDGIPKSRWSLKCQSCNDKKLAASGAKVQCVNGKCPKAFHVTCARDDDQVVHRVWHVEEFEQVPLPADAPAETEPEFIKVSHLKTEILCPGHNPEVKEAKKRQQAEELRSKVLALVPGQPVKIKTAQGSYQVKYVGSLEAEPKAEVKHDDGSLSLVKWADIDFRPTHPPQPLENEYARVHTHVRRNGAAVPIHTLLNTQSTAATAATTATTATTGEGSTVAVAAGSGAAKLSAFSSATPRPDPGPSTGPMRQPQGYPQQQKAAQPPPPQHVYPQAQQPSRHVPHHGPPPLMQDTRYAPPPSRVSGPEVMPKVAYPQTYHSPYQPPPTQTGYLPVGQNPSHMVPNNMYPAAGPQRSSQMPSAMGYGYPYSQGPQHMPPPSQWYPNPGFNNPIPTSSYRAPTPGYSHPAPDPGYPTYPPLQGWPPVNSHPQHQYNAQNHGYHRQYAPPPNGYAPPPNAYAPPFAQP